MKARRTFILLSVLITGISLYWTPVWWFMVLFGPLIIIGYADILQKKQTIRRNFPVIGNIRYMLEKIRPEIMQYFVETDLDGRPINRIFRSLIYERAKNVNDTTPFGTQYDVYRIGYEFMTHSIYAKSVDTYDISPRVHVGGKDCKKPYSASILNISAMSFGSLSQNAILALNGGAKAGNFAHNTGEGGISPYHLQHGGDLIWQIGTGYFGCRDNQGNFDPELFKEKSNLENVKMIEIKLSQGAKPGHGGILPAKKNTPEIAAIRNVEAAKAVISPPAHTAFSNPDEMMHFIKQLRELSNEKPIGFKLCVGSKTEFISICKAMIATDIRPDFITVDSADGGTGAAPLPLIDDMGLRRFLVFVSQIGYSHYKETFIF
ncbi:MAG: FMN-binding glutamate synthase family protein [Bacteroidales bacterium]|nr:FMN-binding glutamate synthase family protein [Bacteroidales bacterium]